MKKELFYILLLLLFSMTTTAQTTQTDFDYHLDWGGDRIHVTLHYTLPNPGDTILHYGNLDYGGQTDIFGCIKNLRAKGADITADSIHRTVTLHNIQEKEICLTYDIVSRLPNKGLNCPKTSYTVMVSIFSFVYPTTKQNLIPNVSAGGNAPLSLSSASIMRETVMQQFPAWQKISRIQSL